DDDEHGQAVSGRALADDWFERATAMIAQLANDGAAGVDTASSSIPPLKLTFTTPRAGYLARIKKIIALIKAGEVYQICLTNEMVGTIVGVDGAPVPLASLPSLAPITTTATHVVGQRGMKATTTKKKKEYILPSFLQLYRALAAHNNTSYRALMVWRRPEDGLAGDDRVMAGAVCCFSPENFLRVEAGGCITTQPIKGTMGRGKGKVEDERLKNTLQASAKNQAENIMIVDLLRNDLSRVATMGSVRVPHINRLETYDHVHQLVSTITADLAAGHDLVDLLGSAFPGGSMTGAPKIRAMELLDQLEARQRGIYAGMIGFIGGDGACQLAMVIRTLLVERRPYRPSMSLPMSL
ncbi:MAG: chorismate-binding protein, partial [Alphaproteobacteria bacterium]|nr:chorismate-binding protein [Alphaproteobacteria bacterium]